MPSVVDGAFSGLICFELFPFWSHSYSIPFAFYIACKIAGLSILCFYWGVLTVFRIWFFICWTLSSSFWRVRIISIPFFSAFLCCHRRLIAPFGTICIYFWGCWAIFPELKFLFCMTSSRYLILCSSVWNFLLDDAVTEIFSLNSWSWVSAWVLPWSSLYQRSVWSRSVACSELIDFGCLNAHRFSCF